MGGWQAAQLADQLNSKYKQRCVLSNLITLDPVGTIYSWNPLGAIKFKTPKTKGPVWTNVRAESSNLYPGWNNIVANLGGQWNPAESGLNPTYNYEVEADHLSINLMMTHKVLVQGKSQSFSPIDLLNQYYLNNLKLINTFQ